MSNQPLVSIGLPTFNRAASLASAIESALAQDYQNLELIISDNASTDETAALCARFARHDSRVRYLRQETNRGPIFNFRHVLSQAQGEFFVWLGDDDWMDQRYLSECMEVLIQHADYELTCGRCKYFDGEEVCFEESVIKLEENKSSRRVLAYFQQVGPNGMFYGVMRRRTLSGLQLQDTLGADWLLLGQIACLGKVSTVESVSINRSISGLSRSVEKLASMEGWPGIVARNAHLLIACKIFKDIGWNSPVYAPLGSITRVWLGLRSAMAVVRTCCLPAWLTRLLDGWDNLRTRWIIRTRLKRGLSNIRRKAI